MKNKVAVTTTSFAKYDETPLQLLNEMGFEVITNSLGRKLSRKETLKICNAVSILLF